MSDSEPLKPSHEPPAPVEIGSKWMTVMGETFECIGFEPDGESLWRRIKD